MSPKEPAISSLKQFKKKLQDHVEALLHEKFRWSTVEKWVMDILRERVEDIIMGGLGYDWESGFSGKGHWVLKDHDDKIGVPQILLKMATTLAAKYIPQLIKEREEALVAKFLSPANRNAIVKTFGYEFDKILREAMDEWVKKHATTQVEELFDKYGEELLKEVKLKHKLTMDSIELIGEG